MFVEVCFAEGHLNHPGGNSNGEGTRRPWRSPTWRFPFILRCSRTPPFRNPGVPEFIRNFGRLVLGRSEADFLQATPFLGNHGF